METHTPFFTVAIPTYSRLAYLKEAVQSILSQTFQDLEICLSQDPLPTGPHPEVLAWSQDLAARHPNVRLQVNATTRGLAGNWNELVRMARGKYLMIIGDDDRLQPAYLEEMAAIMASTQAGVAFSNQVFIDSKGHEIPGLSDTLNTQYGRTGLETGLLKDPLKVVLGNSVPMSAAVMQTEALKRFTFKEDLNTPEIEVFLRFALEGGTFAYVNKPLAEYRIHQQSATSSGLTIDRLLGYLYQIRVPQTHEAYKKAFFADKIIPAVNISLRRGDRMLARQLLRSGYYPPKVVHRAVQLLCLYLPLVLVRKILA